MKNKRLILFFSLIAVILVSLLFLKPKSAPVSMEKFCFEPFEKEGVVFDSAKLLREDRQITLSGQELYDFLSALKSAEVYTNYEENIRNSAGDSGNFEDSISVSVSGSQLTYLKFFLYDSEFLHFTFKNSKIEPKNLPSSSLLRISDGTDLFSLAESYIK